MRALILFAIAATGCEPTLIYVCHEDAQCNTAPGGKCVQSYCAFPDGTCPSGLKWDPSAAALAGQCVAAAADAGSDQAVARDLATSDLAQDAAVDMATVPDMTHVLTWTAQTSGTGSYLSDIWGTGPNDVYAVGSSGAIVHSKNGVSWTPFFNSPTTADLNSVWGSSMSDVYVVGASGGIWRTADQGGTWTKQSSGTSANLYRVWGSGGGDIFVVGSAGTILHTTDSGTTWKPLTSGTAQDLFAVWGPGQNDVYAAGTSGVVLHSGGGAWSVQHSSNINDRLTTISGTSMTNVFTANPGLLFQSTGNGTWVDVKGRLNRAGIYRLWSYGDSIWGVEGISGTSIYQSLDDGTTWSQLPTMSAAALDGIWGTSPTNIYVVGSGGTILHGQ